MRFVTIFRPFLYADKWELRPPPCLAKITNTTVWSARTYAEQNMLIYQEKTYMKNQLTIALNRSIMAVSQ